MKFLPTYAALVAGSASAMSVSKDIVPRNTSDLAKLVVTTPNSLWLFDYNGAELTWRVNLNTQGTFVWTGLVQEDRLYAVDPDSSTLAEYTLDIATNDIKSLHEADSWPGLTHIAFNQDSSRLLASAGDGNGVELWDTSDGLATKIKDISIGDLEHAWSGSQSAVLDPTGRYFFVNNLGTLDITVIDTKDDAYTIAGTIGVGYSYCGPISGVFYPPGAAKATHYIVSCYGSAYYGGAVQLYALTYQENTIKAVIKQYEMNYEWSSDVDHYGEGGTIAVVGDDVYVATSDSTQPEDLIVHFTVEKTNGTVALKRQESTLVGGLETKMFAVTDDGKDLLVANNWGENAITVLRRGTNGKLDPTPVTSVAQDFFGRDDGPRFIGQVGRV